MLQRLCRFGSLLTKYKGGTIPPVAAKRLLLSREASASASSSSGQPPKSSSANEFEELDKPIQYTTSAASQWTAERTHSGALHPDVPDYQPYVVVFSVGMLLLYFGVLREENDIDEEIAKPLWEKIPGLEKTQIITLLKYNTEHNISVDALVKRLKEIEEMEAKAKTSSEKK